MLVDQFIRSYSRFIALFFLFVALFCAYQVLILYDHNRVFYSLNIFFSLFYLARCYFCSVEDWKSRILEVFILHLLFSRLVILLNSQMIMNSSNFSFYFFHLFHFVFDFTSITYLFVVL